MICVWSADCTDFSTRGNGTKTHNGRGLYSWRKETIERFFAEAKKTMASAAPACSESGTCGSSVF